MSVHRMIMELIAKDRGATRALKKTSAELGKVDKAAEKMGRGLSGLGAIAGAGGLLALGGAAGKIAFDLVDLGAKSARLETSLAELARQAGGSGDAIVSAMRRASGGTIAEMDMMLAANKGIMLGLGAQASEWEKLTEVARFRARAMGIDTTQALNDITVGIGRESRMILDNLGIILDMDQVMQDYADTLGTTADKLDQTQRKQAIMQSVIQEGSAMIAEAGDIANDYADDIEAMGAAWADLKVEAGQAVAGFDLLRESMQGLTTIMRGEGGEQLGKNMEAAAASGSSLDAALLGVAEGFDAVAVRAALMAAGFGSYVVSAKELDAAMSLVAEATSADAVLLGTYTEKVKQIEQVWPEVIPELNSPIDPLKRQGDALEDTTQELDAYTKALIALRSSKYGPEPGLLTASDREKANDPTYHANVQAEITQTIEDETRRRVELQKDAAEESARAWESAYEDLRSTIKSALTPTSVTAADMEAASMGTYVDKWDEDARRLDAIAQHGFAELQKHADWAAILKIPPEVLAGSENALKEWASRTSGEVRGLMRPDLLADNLPAMVQQVKDYMARQEAVELTIDMVAAEMAGAGVSREQVAKALGMAEGEEAMRMPVQLVPVSGEGEEVGSAADTGVSMAEEIQVGFAAALETMQFAWGFSDALEKDVDTNSDRLFKGGERLWKAVEPGIKHALKETPWVQVFARHMAPYVADVLINRGFTSDH